MSYVLEDLSRLNITKDNGISEMIYLSAVLLSLRLRGVTLFQIMRYQSLRSTGAYCDVRDAFSTPR